MNDILELKGSFEQRKNTNSGGGIKLPKNGCVNVAHLEELKENLEKVYLFWENNTLINNALVSVYYDRVVAKSNRVKTLLHESGINVNDTVVGAKFLEEKTKDSKRITIKHVITHCVKLSAIKKAILSIENAIKVLKDVFKGSINEEDVEFINKKVENYKYGSMSKTGFLSVIFDACYVERFGVEKASKSFDEKAIITIYKTGTNTEELMRKLKIDFLNVRRLDDETFLLTPDQYLILKEKAPYLIAMAVSDLNKLRFEHIKTQAKAPIIIPKPKNEPVIGVIDMMFDENVYFHEWVEFVNMLDEEIPIEPKDYNHGTEVSSIIVDGPASNPDLEDGCGRFRVKHFGVATNSQFSSYIVIKAIKEIVAKNKDIKVWNLSLGSSLEINDNFISPEAAILDEIQYKNDVIFVVAGTNKNSSVKKSMKIGAPADSINSIVVNSVDSNNKPASYTRDGRVLSFYNKPDVSYYGGSEEQPIRVCSPLGESLVKGTSFAAPWITRKMAYLIYIMGFSREVAKALLINSATKWKRINEISNRIGYGVVPKKIEDVIKSPNDEIRFILSGISENYEVYNFNIPVPIYKEKYPFLAKATLCYFPKCSRSQGVDYTNTELNVKFGRINKMKINSINNNKQGNSDAYDLCEDNARKFFRKWDNVKYISEELKDRSRARILQDGIWGISVIKNERLNNIDGLGINFAIVLTLKEMQGVNRLEDFIKLCSYRGWIVNRIKVDNRIDIYNKAEEHIHFD